MLRTLCALGLAVALAISAPALACVDDCYTPILLPRDGSIPSNAFVFKVVSEPLEVRLVDGRTKREIPSSVKTRGPDRVWSPDVPLGDDVIVDLTYRSSCVEDTASFRTTGPASLDKEASLSFVENEASAPHGQRRTSTYLVYEPPTTHENYLLLEIEVDGEPYALAYSATPYAPPSLYPGFWAICDIPKQEGECTTDISPELHEVVFRTRPVGGEAVSTLKIAVDLRCDVERVEGVSSELEERGDGCQLGGASGGAWMLLALLLRRRRRR
jgi:hypothetical protein